MAHEMTNTVCVRGLYRVRKEGGSEKVRRKEFSHTGGKEEGEERKGQKRRIGKSRA
jgi:hypothetical protein